MQSVGSTSHQILAFLIAKCSGLWCKGARFPGSASHQVVLGLFSHLSGEQ